MAHDTIRIIAAMKAREGKEEELRAVLEDLVEPSRAEEACLQYDLHENLDDPTEFVFVEQWRDAEGLDAHTKTDHFRSGSAKLAGLLGGRPQLRRCKLLK
jgi:quinol monooxygenase YgiN